MSKKVVFYNTSATGFLQTKKNAAAIQQLLTAKKVPFTVRDPLRRSKISFCLAQTAEFYIFIAIGFCGQPLSTRTEIF
jgi:hypothetical protein